MYRGPAYGGRSKATASTQCQKCLQKGHYSYECKVNAQERPYKARPSRTQQLFNPNLRPKLTTEVPNDLLRKKGVADELLAKKEQERGRKPNRDDNNSTRKRSRSYSSDSVSTISTNRSPSRSNSPPRHKNGSVRGADGGRGKRARRSVSSDSHTDDIKRGSDRHTRRRVSSFSPGQRGRRGRSRSSHMDVSYEHESQRKDGRRSKHKSRSRSRGRRRLNARRSRSRSRSVQSHGKRTSRRLSPSPSRSRSSHRMDISQDRNGSRRSLSRSLSPPRRGRRSSPRLPRRSIEDPIQSSRKVATKSPDQVSERRTTRSPSPFRAQTGGRGSRFDDASQHQSSRNGPPASAPAPSTLPRERSLSPYSKRVALTRQIHGAR